jgi:hypothetical protein
MGLKETDVMAWLLGYEPSLPMRVEILQTIKDTGRTLEEVCAERSLPDLLLVDEAGRCEYEGQFLSPQQIRAKNPGKKFVFIF